VIRWWPCSIETEDRKGERQGHILHIEFGRFTLNIAVAW
jgi:hypothetical protein